MSGSVIPVSPEYVSWRQRTALDGVEYLFDFNWNDRNGSWSISMYKADGTPLRNGVVIDIQRPLFPSPTLDMPKGVMVAIDLSGSGESPTLTDFGKRVILKYYSVDQLADL